MTSKTSMARYALIALTLIALPSSTLAQRVTELGNICHLKGQEENVLRGLGLVVGLNGTGESNDPSTMKALSRAMQLMGNPVSATGRYDEQAEEALRNIKNVALVMVTATVPAQGARAGNRIDCTVSALNGKSLVGGRLIAAALLSNASPVDVYGHCEGPITISDPSQPTGGYVHAGCQMARDVVTPYVSSDGWLTLVLDQYHADFKVAQAVTDKITDFFSDDFKPGGADIDENTIRRDYVQAVNAANIRVRVPQERATDPVSFIARLLELEVADIEPEARVVCDTRTGAIAITGEVAIGTAVFAHQNLAIETGPAPGFEAFSTSDTARPRLDRLVQALSTLKVAPRDQIEIIRQIHKLGKLHAKLEIY